MYYPKKVQNLFSLKLYMYFKGSRGEGVKLTDPDRSPNPNSMRGTGLKHSIVVITTTYVFSVAVFTVSLTNTSLANQSVSERRSVATSKKRTYLLSKMNA